ncbi:MAG: hypothetical protein B6I31_00785 [Desulfobacteraceae bacterium 4572_19]|nr:MAG: hypothetical protein B6I31_00785 [Desulfobacteraceae bacterium 4572_19]
MNLKNIIATVTNKNKFLSIADYSDFCLTYLEFIQTKLQAVIVSRNENNYRFFQYKKDGTYNVTRPVNSNLMLSLEVFDSNRQKFLDILNNIKSATAKVNKNRKLLNDYIYTCQQSIGAALDALPAKKSNTARKINGDLFERFIRLIIQQVGIDVTDGTIAVPVKINGSEAFKMKYQHDLIIKVDDVTKAIGSVKTSSKDRIDKIFIDKFLYNRLTDTQTPHFAIFLNDVQRKGKEGKYGINDTFLPGHFKGYTIKLNPLDGVYYLDIRPNMKTEDILKDHIKTFDNFLIKDIWKFAK